MSYSIRYGGQERYSPRNKRIRKNRILFGAGIVAAAIAVHFIWPETGEYVRQFLFPGASDTLSESFAAFSQAIGEGESIGSALNTFCMDVVNEAGWN